MEIVEQGPVVGVRSRGHGDAETQFAVFAHIACDSGSIVGTVVEGKGGFSSGNPVGYPLSVKFRAGAGYLHGIVGQLFF